MPDQTDVHVDVILTNLSLKYKNKSFVGDRLFPPVPVKKQSNKYFVYGKENFSIPNTLYSKKAGFNRIDWSVSNDSYYADERGLEAQITEAERDNADSPLMLDQDTTEYLTDMIFLEREYRVVSQVTSTSVITQNKDLSAAGNLQWDDPNSDPFEDIDAAKEVIEANGIPEPDVLTIPKQVFRKLKEHPKVIAKLAYTERGIITADILAAMFEVSEVLVPDSLYNTKPQGQTPVLARVWPKAALLSWSPRRMGLKTIGLGATFEWKRRQVERYPERKTKSEVMRNYYAEDQKVIAASAAYLFDNAIA